MHLCLDWKSINEDHLRTHVQNADPFGFLMHTVTHMQTQHANTSTLDNQSKALSLCGIPKWCLPLIYDMHDTCIYILYIYIHTYIDMYTHEMLVRAGVARKRSKEVVCGSCTLARMSTHTHAHTHTHARKHAHAHKHL